MKSSTPYLSFLFAFISFSCGHDQKRTEETEIVPEVEVTTIKSLRPQLEVVLPGELKPWNRASIYAKVNGYVGQVLVDRGSRVKKGQLLVILDAPELRSGLSQALAKVSAAEASLIEQKARQQASALTYRRIVETSQTPGAVSANELDINYSRMMADSALAKAAYENLNAAQASHAAQVQLVEYLSVRAPFDGTITERNVSPGDLVAEKGAPLLVLEDHSTLRLTVPVPENLTNSIQEDSKVSFSVEADPSKIYDAQFARSANSLQESNRTMIAEFDFKNPNGDLKAGMYAEVKMPVTRNGATLFVPRSAVVNSTEGVFLVRIKESAAEWIGVQKGNALDSLVEVFGPIREGDQIVTKASEELRNGKPLKIIKLKT